LRDGTWVKPNKEEGADRQYQANRGQDTLSVNQSAWAAGRSQPVACKIQD